MKSKLETCGGDILRTYKDKEELKNEINKSFEKYISEFDNIPESLKDKRIIEVDRTPAENLAYQLGLRSSQYIGHIFRIFFLKNIKN